MRRGEKLRDLFAYNGGEERKKCNVVSGRLGESRSWTLSAEVWPVEEVAGKHRGHGKKDPRSLRDVLRFHGREIHAYNVNVKRKIEGFFFVFLLNVLSMFPPFPPYLHCLEEKILFHAHCNKINVKFLSLKFSKVHR